MVNSEKENENSRDMKLGDDMLRNEIPLGLGFSLAMNEKAMENFARMDDAARQRVVDSARNVYSKAQMEGIVRAIAEGTAL